LLQDRPGILNASLKEKPMDLNHFSLARTLLVAGSLAGLVLAANVLPAQDDPPFGAARIARIQGNVSIQPNSIDDWGQAYPNQPVGPGDRLYTDQQSQGELQVEQVRAYFGANSDVTLVNLNRLGVLLGVAQGSANIFSDGFGPGMGSMFIQTPNGAVGTTSRASFRVDVFPNEQSTVVTNFPNSAELAIVGGGGFSVRVEPGESIQLTGTNPIYAQPLQPAPSDPFQQWSMTLETQRFNSISARYVSAEMPGYDQLDAAGDWQPQSDYGPIWFPHVEAGWAPYHYGHWVHMPFFGWTWVADEPWGAAPFHYGRWVVAGGRWGWIPGSREGHPVWSPAQVVFAGGIQAGGVGVSVWFPLGPGEAYKPWYPCTPQYINQINITNIHESRVVHVQTTYVNIVNVTNVTYVNRTVGVTAMRQTDFAAGRSTKAVPAVKVDPQQLAHVQPARPEAPPPAKPMILHPIAKPAAVAQQRPVLINSKGQQAVAAPNAKPVPVPVKAAPPAPKPLPGHTAIGTPTVGGKPVAAPPTAPKPAPVTPSTPSAKAPVPAAPVRTSPAPTKAPVQPAPAKVSLPPAGKAPVKPAPTNAPAPKKPATEEAPAKTPPAPAAKPHPAATTTEPVKPANGKPASGPKGEKKKDGKKDEKENPPKKPE
jgi:hypothetical protein